MALFVDDVPANVEAARRLGFAATQFRGAEHLRAAPAPPGLPAKRSKPVASKRPEGAQFRSAFIVVIGVRCQWSNREGALDRETVQLGNASVDTLEMVRRGIIATDISPGALEPYALRALRKLGYQIVPDGASLGTTDQPIQPDLRIVDEESLGQIAGEEGASVPVIILTRQLAPPPANRQVYASLMRPVLFHALYAAIQEALEPTPRRHPRITTELPARCAYDDRICAGAVTSLSEGGCLFRNPDGLSWEHETILQFSLPRPGLISTRAQPVYQRGSDEGFAFQGLLSDFRLAISQYVMNRLLSD
jgi:hypothetical protein